MSVTPVVALGAGQAHAHALVGLIPAPSSFSGQAFHHPFAWRVRSVAKGSRHRLLALTLPYRIGHGEFLFVQECSSADGPIEVFEAFPIFFAALAWQTLCLSCRPKDA
ncbi:hypothetical protein MPSEU_001024000 [Mayamaea pseudoterrestris]|nr:hypothetical protein MPSEU_001024000 [Mayamaea pseudoterrestris]